MTDIKISALPTIAQGSVGVATDSIPITQGAVTYKVTPTALVFSSINTNSTGSGSVVLSTNPVINGGTIDDTVIGYLPSGAGAVASTVQNKLRESVSVKDFGAVGDGVTDDTAAFTAAGSTSAAPEVLIPAGTYKLNSTPTPTGIVTWIVQKGASFTGAGKLSFLTAKIVSRGAYRSLESDASFYGGIFGYLEQNAAETGYGVLGLHGVAQTLGGSGGAGEADIGVAGFAANNLVGGSGGAWALYGTALHASGVNGNTHGMELDIANIGSTVPLFPAAMFPSGNTNALWLASGGEATATPGAVKTASCAIGIISNDPAGIANFQKGIVFHNKSLAGCDGLTGNATALALASGHQILWFNNSNQACAEIVSNAKTNTNGTRIDFSDFGLLIADRITGGTLAQFSSIPNSVNYLTLNGAITGNNPNVTANGSGANIDIGLRTKGAGNIDFLNATVAGTASALVGYMTVKINGTQYKMPYYNL